MEASASSRGLSSSSSSSSRREPLTQQLVQVPLVVATPVLEAETVEEELEEASGPDSDFGIELEVSSDED